MSLKADLGLSWHLATITSQAEQEFIAGLLPGTLLLLGSGISALALRRRRKSPPSRSAPSCPKPLRATAGLLVRFQRAWVCVSAAAVEELAAGCERCKAAAAVLSGSYRSAGEI